MIERPIIMSAESVRAILSGRKTQTRRVVTKINNHVAFLTPDRIISVQDALTEYPELRNKALDRCPYPPGDRLWVREAWADPCGEKIPAYRADNATAYADIKWRPSIHMPRWASRLTLEVTGVRVERVQDISEEDAIKEGMDWAAPQPYAEPDEPMETGGNIGSFAWPNFRTVWDTINARRGFGWDANPWVWVVEFRRVG